MGNLAYLYWYWYGPSENENSIRYAVRMSDIDHPNWGFLHMPPRAKEWPDRQP